MSDQMNGLSNHALQNSTSNQASFSPSINNDQKKRPPLFMCGECLQLFLDLGESTQHWRKCKLKSETGDLYLTNGTLELSIDVVRYLFGSATSSFIPNETNSQNQSADSMNEPVSTRNIANQSPIESNHQQSIGNNAHPILEQTRLNSIVDDQSITAINETSVQNHSGPVVKDNPQSTDSMTESVIPRSIPNQSPVESNHQQSTGDNADLILKQIELNGLVDDQSITAVNETSIQNHYESEAKENPLDVNVEEVDTKTSSNHLSEKTFKCKECIKCFSNKSKLKRHIKSVHRNIRQFKCEECSKSFSQKPDLNRHIKSVHQKIRQFKCEECFKRFSRKSDLNRHIELVHQGIRPFKCEECIKSFTEKRSLNNHTQKVHRGIWPFKCEKCIKFFAKKDHLNTHFNSVHQIILYNCEECVKCFTQKSSLNRHVQSVHQGIKKFKCEKCFKNFSQKAHLNKHIKSVHRDI